jgi:DNA-binding MarR family transcriptional regulator
MIGVDIVSNMTNVAIDADTAGLLGERRSSPGLLLALLGQHAMRRLREAHVGQDLSPRQFVLLALLSEGGPTGQTELGQAMEIDPSVLVTLLNPLEERGLIARVRSATDRRRHLVSLTAQGEHALLGAVEAQREVEDQLFAGFQDERRELLGELLVELQEVIKPDCARACAEEAGEWVA